MAGRNSSAQPRRPNFLCSFSHPATQPGVVTEWIPSSGIRLWPLAFKASNVIAAGAQPLALMPVSLPVLASQ